MMKALIAQAERGEITGTELRNQIDVIHAIKVELDARMIEDDLPAAPEPVQESMFKIPERGKAAPPVSDRAHARTSDPWTSHAAAKAITKDDLRGTQAAVLACFNRFGPMHHERLVEVYEAKQSEFGWPQQSVSGLRTRTSELVGAGLLRDGRRTVRLVSGRQSIVWEVPTKEES